MLFSVLALAVAQSSSAAKKSFYILFAEQIDSPGFPESICQNAGRGPQGSECVDGRDYSVFIASPQGNMTAAHLVWLDSLYSRRARPAIYPPRRGFRCDRSQGRYRTADCHPFAGIKGTSVDVSQARALELKSQHGRSA